MKIDLPIKFIIKIFNDKSVALVNVLVGTNIFVDLNKLSESLTQISANFWNQIRIRCKRLPFKLHRCSSQIIQRSIIYFLIVPVTIDKYKVLTGTYITLDAHCFLVTIGSSDVTITIDILGGEHDAHPGVLVAIISEILSILL